LIDLGRVRLHVLEALPQLGRELDRVADQTAEHALETGDALVQIQHGGLNRLAPTEGEELGGDARGPLGRAPDARQVVPRRGGVVDVVEGDLAHAMTVVRTLPVRWRGPTPAA
jgi:hypothetical protein